MRVVRAISTPCFLLKDVSMHHFFVGYVRHGLLGEWRFALLAINQKPAHPGEKDIVKMKCTEKVFCKHAFTYVL
jgi:hypothetical protein